MAELSEDYFRLQEDALWIVISNHPSGTVSEKWQLVTCLSLAGVFGAFAQHKQRLTAFWRAETIKAYAGNSVSPLSHYDLLPEGHPSNPQSVPRALLALWRPMKHGMDLELKYYIYAVSSRRYSRANDKRVQELLYGGASLPMIHHSHQLEWAHLLDIIIPNQPPSLTWPEDLTLILLKKLKYAGLSFFVTPISSKPLSIFSLPHVGNSHLLWRCIRAGCTQLVEFMLENGADPNSIMYLRDTASGIKFAHNMLATAYEVQITPFEKSYILTSLLLHGAKVNDVAVFAPDEVGMDASVLMTAAKRGDLDTCKLFLDYGSGDPFWTTPRDKLSRLGHYHSYLLFSTEQHGRGPSPPGSCAYTEALYYENSAIVQLFDDWAGRKSENDPGKIAHWKMHQYLCKGKVQERIQQEEIAKTQYLPALMKAGHAQDRHVGNSDVLLSPEQIADAIAVETLQKYGARGALFRLKGPARDAAVNMVGNGVQFDGKKHGFVCPLCAKVLRDKAGLRHHLRSAKIHMSSN